MNQPETTMKSLLSIIAFLSTCSLVSAQNYSEWFTDVTEEVGLDVSRGSKVSVADINNDGWPDILVGEGNLIKFKFHLFMNEEVDGKRVFVDRTEESGMNARRGGKEGDRIADVVALADVDNDGDLDLISSIYYHRWEMYNNDTKDPGDRTELLLNDGTGKFTLSDQSGLWNATIPEENSPGLTNATGMATVDFDLDGDLDLYISQWFEDYKQNLEVNAFRFKFEDLLFENDGNGNFTFVPNSGLAPYKEANYGVNVLDWNNDGYTDITTSAYCRSGGYLFANQGALQFDEVSGPANLTSQPMGGDHGQALCQWEGMPADFDNDGDFDIFHTLVHGGMADSEGRSFISENLGEEENFRFTNRMDLIQREQRLQAHVSDMGASWIDLDNDGLQDLIVAQSGYLEANPIQTVNLFIFQQQSDHFFTDITKQTGSPAIVLDPHSPCAIDYDLDGDYDIVTSYTYRDTITQDSLRIDSTETSPGVWEYDTTEVSYTLNRAWSSLKMIRNDVGNKQHWAGVELVNIPEGINSMAIGSRIEIYSLDRVQTRELHLAQGHFGGQEDTRLLFGLGNMPFIDSAVVYLPNKERTRKVFYNLDINTTNRLDLGDEVIAENTNAKLQFNIPKADLGTVNVGEEKEITVSIINKSAETISLAATEIEGSPIFTSNIEDIGTFTLAPNEEREITVKGIPLARKLYWGSIQFNYEGNEGTRELFIRMQGFEPKPIIAASTRSLTFDPIWRDSVDTRTVTISNTGEEELLVSSIRARNFPEDFIASPNEFTVAPGGSQEVNVSFEPTDLGDYEDIMIMTTNAYNDTISSITVSGICDGPRPDGRIQSFVVVGKVKVGEEKEKTFEIQSTGITDLEITGMETDEFEEEFDFSQNSFPAIIKPNEKQEFSVIFRPTVLDKTYNTRLVVHSNAYTEDIGQAIIASSDIISNVQEALSQAIYISEYEGTVTLSRFSTGGQLSGEYRVSLFDMTGKEIGMSQIWDKGMQQMTIPVNASGVVFISLLDMEKGLTATEKIMIRQ